MDLLGLLPTSGSQLGLIISLTSVKITKKLDTVATEIHNFDDVLVPADHVSRSYNDTYYVDSQTVLRCHTSGHQAELLRRGNTFFLVTGNVYHRDSIDSTHYPVFYQVLWRCVGLMPIFHLPILLTNLKSILSVTWAFGLGLERLAMVYLTYQIFIFSGQMMSDLPHSSPKAKWESSLNPFPSILPVDMSCWINDSFTENNLCEVMRGIAGDLVEEVKSKRKIDEKANVNSSFDNWVELQFSIFKSAGEKAESMEASVSGRNRLEMSKEGMQGEDTIEE
ncbi:hypothetical protein CRYUN_Cryun36dG0032100 [Craigia yunnanensis]